MSPCRKNSSSRFWAASGVGAIADAGPDGQSQNFATDGGGALREAARPDDAPANRQRRCAEERTAEFTIMRQLAMQFRGLLMGGSIEKLDAWLHDAQLSGIYAMQRFARAARQDIDAVRNAVLEPGAMGRRRIRSID